MRAIISVSGWPCGGNGHRSVALSRKSFAAAMRKTPKTGRGPTMAEIDRLISAAGAVALILSAFYFAPIVGSIFMK
ncbi:MAG: hypothetical protein PHW80_07330 [Smithellaceae bacterium]|jgi:hypothetical protein|nr:hypothetical protein [Smithellaceae bacterium]MDD3258387.1 hypothetical protein [Smithellaceae bacterium]MDD3849096.1 hypothetical protein [Smithellaceae bacterium]HOG11510.1 hypothetical protein [Smithellaceae bacterium]HOQ71821.1 hypothetical protein [Smithellaceae bacterium]